MPIYDYKCDFCKYILKDVLVRHPTPGETVKCDNCESGIMHQQMGAPNVKTNLMPKFHRTKGK